MFASSRRLFSRDASSPAARPCASSPSLYGIGRAEHLPVLHDVVAAVHAIEPGEHVLAVPCFGYRDLRLRRGRGNSRGPGGVERTAAPAVQRAGREGGAHEKCSAFHVFSVTHQWPVRWVGWAGGSGLPAVARIGLNARANRGGGSEQFNHRRCDRPAAISKTRGGGRTSRGCKHRSR